MERFIVNPLQGEALEQFEFTAGRLDRLFERSGVSSAWPSVSLTSTHHDGLYYLTIELLGDRFDIAGSTQAFTMKEACVRILRLANKLVTIPVK